MGELLEIERELAGVIELSDLAGPLLLRVQRFIGASGSLLSCFEQERAGPPSVRGGSLADALREYAPDLVPEDPIFPWNHGVSPRLFLVTGEGFDLKSYVKCRPYLEFYRPHGIGYMVGVRPTGLRYGSRHMFSMMFVTPTIDERPRATDLNKLWHLEVPLRAAAARIERFRSLQHRDDVLRQLLERQQGSFVLWNADGRKIWISRAAHAQLEGTLASTDLELAAARAFRQLRRGGVSEREARLGRPVSLCSGRGAPLLVEFSWIRAPDGSLCLLAEIESGAGSKRLLAQLSNAELRVLRLLMSGSSNRDISERLGVSRETVKSHVKHILSKLGVSSRGKAIHLLTQGLSKSPPDAGVNGLGPGG